ncbi:MAG: tetratricopeptide repeat protein [Alphaproteobacteria bacterium]
MRALIIALFVCTLGFGSALADSCDERDASENNPNADIRIELNTQCLKDRSDNQSQASSYVRRAIAYSDKGDDDRAIADFTKAIALNPKFINAYYDRGLVYISKGDYDRAIADLNQAIGLDPNDAISYSNRGAAYSGKGDYDRAIADLNQAIALNPNYAETYNNRGNAYAHKQECDRAIPDYTKAIALNSNFAGAYNNRGRAYYDKGDYDRAIADLNQAIVLDPKLATAYYNRGVTYGHKGDYGHAIADYNQAIALAPNDARTYDSEAWLLATCPDAKYRNGVEAVRLASKAIQLEDNWLHRQSLAAAKAETGQFEEAAKEQQKVIEMAKAANVPAVVLARLHEQLDLYWVGIPYHEENVTPAAQLSDKLDPPVGLGEMGHTRAIAAAGEWQCASFTATSAISALCLNGASLQGVKR